MCFSDRYHSYITNIFEYIREAITALQTSFVSEIWKQKDIRKMTEEYLDWRLGIFGILLILALFFNISFLVLRSTLKKEKSEAIETGIILFIDQVAATVLVK